MCKGKWKQMAADKYFHVNTLYCKLLLVLAGWYTGPVGCHSCPTIRPRESKVLE